MAYAGKNATATASSAQNGAPASVSCGGGNAYAVNQNGHTFCVSGKYYSFTYAPNKIDLTLDLPTAPPKKSSSSSSTVQKASTSTGSSSSKGSSSKDSSSTKSSSSGSKDSSSGKGSSSESKGSGSTNSGSGATKLVTLTKKN
ncbi:hypothetical protein [Actinomycetospora corticicola]|uniref:Cobalamin biosynthesis Mg chelatase CobN n=1 Tax=Actinomycetospora corticicola TaxID=663602 RepID=A0A7Y9J3M7_9PSEU|nr:hypothetical protein [Actinomycetospora corticicola]NYD34207.1 cobalamin biosynthesis Mg chelatase CobN [Actinomycetospora corticicola]